MLSPTLRKEEGWLLYDAPVLVGPEAHRPVAPELLLAWTAELAGGCKFAMGVRGAGLRLRAELPAVAADAVRLAAVDAGFAGAAQRLGLNACAEPDAAMPLGHLRLDASPPDLASLFREAAASWPFEERSDGTLAVDLGVEGAYLPAAIEARGAWVATEAEIAQVPEAEGPCRAALAVLLLRANGAFRMARAALRAQQIDSPHTVGPTRRALLEVALPSATSAAELGEAIAALAVAARRCALEAQMVAGNERLARAYLAQCPCASWM